MLTLICFETARASSAFVIAFCLARVKRRKNQISFQTHHPFRNAGLFALSLRLLAHLTGYPVHDKIRLIIAPPCHSISNPLKIFPLSNLVAIFSLPSLLSMGLIRRS